MLLLPLAGPHGPGPTGCLYDIVADPGERHDLAHSQPQDLANLTARLWATTRPSPSPVVWRVPTTVSTRILGKTMRDAVRNKER